jgi:hypothetical protein
VHTAARHPRDTQSAQPLDLRVWPAHLPSGARWLPYNPEAARRESPTLALPPVEVPRRRLAIPFWRLLVAASIGAGFLGILGGMAVGLVLGIH